MRIQVMTDSACDVPEVLVARYGIKIIPAYINFSPTESIPDDGVQITKDIFYERLKKAEILPTTSAYSPGEAESMMREALQTADHIISIHVAANLSGMMNSSQVAAKAIGGDKVTVLDGGALSMGSGWQVVLAAELAAQGLDVATICQRIADMKARSKLWAIPNTLDYLRRSGRINNVMASLGEILQIKPVIGVGNGVATQEGRVRTLNKIIPKLIELAQENSPLERLAILQIDNKAGAEDLKNALAEIAPADQTYIVYASAAIGANFGPGGLGLALVRRAEISV